MEQKTIKEIRMNCMQFAELLIKEREFTLNEGETFVLEHMDSADLISAVEENEPSKRLGTLVEVMRRYSLEISFEGSIHLGSFNVADHSWSLNCGPSGTLKILSKPTTMRKGLAEITSFLSKLPVGQALVLKPYQGLFIEDLPASSLLSYYEYCQEEQDSTSREQKQDEMFTLQSPLLQEKHLTLKIYGMNAKQIDRTIDPQAGGLLFTPVKGDDFPLPRVVLVLLEKK